MNYHPLSHTVFAQGFPCGVEMMPALVVIMFLFYFLVMRPQAKERSKRDQLMRDLKKNDRVMTIGGIYGIVASVNAEKNEVILKVDEENNTKIKVARSSIHTVISQDEGEDKTSK